jgi:hypothetical protein
MAHDQEPITNEELEEQRAEQLPDREVMTILPIEPTKVGAFVPDPDGPEFYTQPVEPPAV